MELIKTKRVHLTGKKAKAFYDDIYARDGDRAQMKLFEEESL